MRRPLFDVVRDAATAIALGVALAAVLFVSLSGGL